MKMMFIVIFYLVCFVHGKFYMNVKNNTFEYVINFKNKCRSQDGMFNAMYGISIAECIGECGIQTQCVAVNYKRRIHKCELFSVLKEGEKNIGDCIYTPASDIKIIPNPCGVCDYGKTCDKSSNSCKYTDCGTLSVIPFGIVSTGETTHGTTAVYTCHYGCEHKGGDLERTCVQGFWNGTKPTCAPIPNIGCYVESHRYKGIHNTTVEGIQCQRWDSQTPHKHNRYNVSTFPEETLEATENYCRDPDLHKEPWCYTINPNKRWDVCGVIKC